MNRQEHWNKVYETKGPHDVSWYQTRPATSLRLIEASGVGPDQGIIDVGGGASVLVDFLLDPGFQKLAVLDISAAALEHAQQRLGARAREVAWFEADVTEFNAPHRFGLWHDRAVFHFLTDKADRQKYLQTLTRTLTPDGRAILATFAVGGPLRCSGLDVVRYDAPSICAELGEGFDLLEQVAETHVTPWGAEQQFCYFRFARKSNAPS